MYEAPVEPIKVIGNATISTDDSDKITKSIKAIIKRDNYVNFDTSDSSSDEESLSHDEEHISLIETFKECHFFDKSAGRSKRTTATGNIKKIIKTDNTNGSSHYSYRRKMYNNVVPIDYTIYNYEKIISIIKSHDTKESITYLMEVPQINKWPYNFTDIAKYCGKFLNELNRRSTVTIRIHEETDNPVTVYVTVRS